MSDNSPNSLRLKIGLQADNFRVHCNIGADKWIGVDMLMTSKPFNYPILSFFFGSNTSTSTHQKKKKTHRKES